MGSFKRDKSKAYMMPITWGPSTCFRDTNGDFKPMEPNVTEDLNVYIEVDPAQLDAVLPEQMTSLNPVIQVQCRKLRHCGWLGGHSYHLIHVMTPVVYNGEKDKDIHANFVLSCAEDHGDPIVAGREFAAYPKPWSEIKEFSYSDGVWRSVVCGWEEPVMKLSIDLNKKPGEETIKELADIDALSRGQLMTWLYWPKVDNLEGGEPYVDCAVLMAPVDMGEDYPYDLMEAVREYGEGQVEFLDTTWFNMPMWYTMYHEMSKLKIKRVIGAYRNVYNDPCYYKGMWRELH